MQQSAAIYWNLSSKSPSETVQRRYTGKRDLEIKYWKDEIPMMFGFKLSISALYFCTYSADA